MFAIRLQTKPTSIQSLQPEAGFELNPALTGWAKECWAFGPNMPIRA